MKLLCLLTLLYQRQMLLFYKGFCFIDIRPDTLNIDENKIEEAITPQTKTIVCVHYAGYLVKWIQSIESQRSIICL